MYVIAEGFQLAPEHRAYTSAAKATKDSTAIAVKGVVPEALQGHPALKSLHMVAMEAIPAWVFEREEIEELSIRSTSPKVLNKALKSIGGLRGLKRLELERNELKKLPPELGQLSELQYLSLSNNKLNALPEECAWKKLQALNLEENPMRDGLPEASAEWSGLEALSFSFGRFKSLPDHAGNWPLRFLSMADCSAIDGLPASASEWKLEYLIIYECKKFKTLPEATFPLKALELIGAKAQIPERYWASSLESLSVHYRRVPGGIPEQLREANELRRLEFVRTDLKKLPEWLMALPKLEHLDVRENNLKSLPPIPKTTSLRFLDAQDNALSDPAGTMDALKKAPISELKI